MSTCTEAEPRQEVITDAYIGIPGGKTKLVADMRFLRNLSPMLIGKLRYADTAGKFEIPPLADTFLLPRSLLNGIGIMGSLNGESKTQEGE